MKFSEFTSIEGSFQHLLYAPNGEIEAVILRSGPRWLQIAIDKRDRQAVSAFESMAPDQMVVVRAAPRAGSGLGRSGYPVYDFSALEFIDGRRAPVSNGRPVAAFRGRVVRLNYARQGQPNGVVLDTGDFIHTRTEGMARLRLQIGDLVEADGQAQRLADNRGWAVEAAHVNGRSLLGG